MNLEDRPESIQEPDTETASVSQSANRVFGNFAATEVWLAGLPEYQQRRRSQQQQPEQNAGSTMEEALAATILKMTLPAPLEIASEMARTAHEDTFGRPRQQG
jgi:hypothetical protein